MIWHKTWRGREIAVRGARWWRDGKLTVDQAIVDPKPCNDYFAMFGLYAAHVRDESGTSHQVEVVQSPWLAGRSIYQLVVDGVVVSRGNRKAPEPPDWNLREETEMQGHLRFLLLYWRPVLATAVLIVVLRYFGQGFDSLGSAVRFSFFTLLGSVAFHAVYASARWYNFRGVNRCRCQKLFGAPAAQQGAAADAQQRVPVEVW